MPTFTTIAVENDTTPTIPFKFVYDDDGAPRNVAAGTVTFTVYGDDLTTPLFPAKTGSPGATTDVQTVTLSRTDTAKPDGAYYAELEYQEGAELLRWHGTFKIEGA